VRASIVAALGCTLGIVPHMVAAITGLAALLHASAVAFAALKYLGVAYLLLLAVMTLRDEEALVVRDSAPPTALRVVAQGVLVNLLNPKLTLFFFAFLPQFVAPGAGATLQMLELSVVFMVVTFAVFAVYGTFAAAVRDRLLRRPRVMAWMRRTFAGTFVALAGKLAVTQR